MFFDNSLKSTFAFSFLIWRFIGMSPFVLKPGPDMKKRLEISVPLYIITIIISTLMIVINSGTFQENLIRQSTSGLEVRNDIKKNYVVTFLYIYISYSFILNK